MNIKTITSPKSYSNSYLNVCPSDEAGLLKYSSSPPTSRLAGKPSPVRSPSPFMMYANNNNSLQPSHQESSDSDLQSVVSKYHANPELLKLILTSKVEEDKRRTEEAKLKAKELDLYFQKQYEYQQETTTNRKSVLFPKEPELVERRRRSSCSSTSSNGSTTVNTIGAVDSIHRRIAPYSIPRPIATHQSTLPRRNSSVSTALFSINKLSINSANNQQQKLAMASSAPSTTSQYLHSQSSTTRSSSDSKIISPVIKTSRRRRSMQAITKIVETTEFPYDDGHFWKNNGNTVQKKTGCKSVYYKCANSCKGCPVNKTVVEQLDGSFMIKYRGDHIIECSQVEHIRDL
ncbi:hypothetical protein BDF21DRAFT_493192 [Thamnidium elegans]|uniref:WRKY domain-containing protein n=1 Tax=Thamnidium elegans TaxID=101142 RepID=A0A8H7W123_9FUNG|nr:hypothetical protein INT48_008125 [Thamnidium elegans]KAI8082463.1 hypothetical protein BDF21DRAFT_493192 [Thamnidium elegans]